MKPSKKQMDAEELAFWEMKKTTAQIDLDLANERLAEIIARKEQWICKRHGDYSNDRVASIGSDVGPDGELIADQCGQCIAECEAATW